MYADDNYFSLRAPVCKNQTKYKIRGKPPKIDFVHIAYIDIVIYPKYRCAVYLKKFHFKKEKKNIFRRHLETAKFTG